MTSVAVWAGAFSLPEEEDTCAIRAQIEADVTPRLRRAAEVRREAAHARAVSAYVDGDIEVDEIERRRARIDADDGSVQIAKAVSRATSQSWESIRKLVWQRDGGVCHICGWKMPEDAYECGHIIDRTVGGTDRPSNVVVMCFLCNRWLKDLHCTRQDYLTWLASSTEVAQTRSLAKSRESRE